MNRSFERTSRNGGFTLTELAIVLAIVGLMLASLLPAISVQMDMRNYNATKQHLSDVREALIGYALTHIADDGKPYLPCPDTGDDGKENRTSGVCDASEGNLPWSDLGIGQHDGWNNRIRYRVHSNFANKSAGFTLASTATLRVCAELTDCGTASSKDLATGLPAVLVSHGKNGAGARNLTGGQNAAPSGGAERLNAHSDGDSDNFVSPTSVAAFDDIVVWLPATILFSRMISAARLP